MLSHILLKLIFFFICTEKADREGGRPSDFSAGKVGVNGFSGNQVWALSKFMAPCVFYVYPPPATDSDNGSASNETKEGSSKTKQRRFLTVAICVPVSPGNSRIIWSFPRNFGVWLDKIIPRWIFHLAQNLVLDSDLQLLHVEERKIKEVGPSNWQKACFVPTKSDALVIAFRRWLNEYAGGGIDWGVKFGKNLPPTPPREQLMDRYWTHVVNCRSCSAAYEGLNALEIVLQITSIALIGFVAVSKQNMLSAIQRNALVFVAVLCFVGSRWLSRFVYKNFCFHDYYHAFR